MFDDGWGIKSFEMLGGDDLEIFGEGGGVGYLLLCFRRLCIHNVGVEGMMHSLLVQFDNESFLVDCH